MIDLKQSLAVLAVVVASENSDSRVTTMKPAKDRIRDNVSEPLDRASAGRVLP
jgi:hypothetical protein